MYAITEVAGKVSGELVATGQPVRAVVRDATQTEAWAERGCEIATDFIEDPSSLAAAFEGSTSVFILPPQKFDPGPGFPEARTVIEAESAALLKAEPDKVVCISTIGAQADEGNLLTQRTLMEQALREVPMPVTFLRPA